MATQEMAQGRIVETMIPARLDRLPWARWHWMVLIGLGTVWILDGLEVTIVGTIAARLTERAGPRITDARSARRGALRGRRVRRRAVLRLAHRPPRAQEALHDHARALPRGDRRDRVLARSWCSPLPLLHRRGIGGEYAAINSAIDELIPARVRGTVDLIINGSFWLGTRGGGAVGLLLNDSLFAADVGWRLAFGLGAVLGVGILLVRRDVPESPRWMFIHGREKEAEKLVDEIEQEVKESAGSTSSRSRGRRSRSASSRRRLREIAKTVFGAYPKRTVLGLSLFIGQAFLYNAVFFTYALVLDKFFGVAGRGRLLHHPVRDRQLPRPAPARPALRHRRAQADDRRHVHPLRRPADRHRVPVRPALVGRDPDGRLVRDLLLRVGRRELPRT